MYKNDDYIDDDSFFVVKYNDDRILSYPDQASRIKFKNIANIYFSGSDDNGDFTYDFIGTQENYDFLLECLYNNLNKYPNLKKEDLLFPKNPLIVEDMEDYFKTF